MLPKIELTQKSLEQYRKEMELNSHSAISNSIRQMEASYENYGITFVTPFIKTLYDAKCVDFEGVDRKHRLILYDYGYGENETEVVKYIKAKYGEANEDFFIVEVSLLVDNDRIYKHGYFVKNGVNTGNDWDMSFDIEKGEKPNCQYTTNEDGEVMVFVRFSVYKIECEDEN